MYDFKTNARVPGEFTNVFPSDVVIVEGILIFYYKNMRFELNIVDFNAFRPSILKLKVLPSYYNFRLTRLNRYFEKNLFTTVMYLGFHQLLTTPRP